MVATHKRQLKLAIDAMPVAPGGGLTVLLGYLRAWRDIEAPLDKKIITWRQPVIDALNQAGFEDLVIVAPVSSRREALIWERRKLPAAINAMGVDVVWISNLFLSGIRAPQVVHHQTLFSLSEDSWLGYARGGLRRVLQHVGARKALRRAARNVFISKYLQDRAERIVPVSHSRNQVIYNGVAPTWLSQVNQPTSAGETSRTICTLSAPSPHKDNESVLQTLAKLNQDHGQSRWRLVIAGPDDWSSWKQRARELKIENDVDFVGYLGLEQVAELYRTSLCTIFPSLFEAFGLPIVEAMACGCPVIAVNRTAMPEVAGDAALLVEPGDVDAMVAAVRSLADDRERYRATVQACYERAQSFSWPKSAATLLQAFWDVVDNRSRS